MPAQGHPYVVACLGSSSTAGKGQAFNWIGALQNRLGQERLYCAILGLEATLPTTPFNGFLR
jgi:hypothetical protein